MRGEIVTQECKPSTTIRKDVFLHTNVYSLSINLHINATKSVRSHPAWLLGVSAVQQKEEQHLSKSDACSRVSTVHTAQD